MECHEIGKRLSYGNYNINMADSAADLIRIQPYVNTTSNIDPKLADMDNIAKIVTYMFST